jgi:eukaryotic-like serine/threonine-protein kinase
MKLRVGDTLGPYQIVALVGAGGMGEVYRAHDPRLRRDVAIKVSTEDYSGRFAQEARAVAALNHPNICTLYDIGPNYQVMEFVEGETLAARLKKGPLPVQEAVALGAQVAGALAAAHAKGLIHRDLKPANIMITGTGAKVLDFGLAKQVTSAEAEEETLTMPMTEPGRVVGTVRYMSPEQAEGKSVDARSDVFAFGIVLYEMLCGRAPFSGDSTLSILASILNTTQVSPSSLRPEISERLEAVVKRCLEKDPSYRYSSAGELMKDLESLRAPASRRVSLSKSAVIAVVLLVLAGVGGLLARSYYLRQRARWAEETAVPQIEKLLHQDQSLAALTLYREAEGYAPNSKLLIKLADGLATQPMNFETDPPGARVYITDYTSEAADDLSKWTLLGEAPIRDKELPSFGYVRLRVVKEGYLTTERTHFFGGEGSGNTVKIDLPAEKDVPPGMVPIPGGTVVILFPFRPPVTVPSFWMDRYEVTNKDFKQFVDAGGYKKSEYWKYPFIKDGRTLSFEDAMAQFHDQTGRPGPALWQLGSYPDGTEDLPVGGVSWYEAEAYAEFAGKSLPTVFEWRQAAQIGANSDVVLLSNFQAKGPRPGRQSRGMSPFGGYDMAGNQAEWTWNANGSNRYLLGGSWEDLPYGYVFSKPRLAFDRSASNGFRCVLRLETPPPNNFADVSLEVTGPLRSKPPVDNAIFAGFERIHRYDKSELDTRAEKTDDSHPYWRRETVSIRAAYGNERIPIHLFLPRNAKPPYQVVAMIGGGTIADVLRRIEDFNYPFEFLLRSGRAVVIPALSGTLERGPTRQFLPENQERERALRWFKDMGRAVDYLETRDDIDAKKLGIYGISLGVMHSTRIVALDSRFKVALLSSGGLIAFPVPETDEWNYAPRVHIPALMLNGRHDFLFPYETSSKPLFDALGTPPDQKAQRLYDGGHADIVARPEAIGEILSWLDKYLGPVEN